MLSRFSTRPRRRYAESSASSVRRRLEAEEASPQRHLRPRDGQEQKTTALELFFDLIYVFAVTQLSHLVIDGGVGLASIGQASFLLLVVWWAWIYTTWMVNWFDPGTSGAVRLVLGAVGLASLLMSAAIPGAFAGQALLFAGAYVILQLGRNVAAMLLLRRDHRLRRVFERVVAWSAAAALFWLAGGIWTGMRDELWGIALLVDVIAPLVGYRTPRLGRSVTADWDVDGGHFAERFQSFIIIALGESIVVTGATAAARGLGSSIVIGLSVAFVITGSLWWLYFGEVAASAQRDLAESDDPGRLARDAYTYLHLPIVAGIIMVAVADDLLISHPGRAAGTAAALMTTMGPALYLAGESAVRLRMIGHVSAKRVVTIVTLVLLAAIGRELPALALSALVAAALVMLSVWENEALRQRCRDLLGARG